MSTRSTEFTMLAHMAVRQARLLRGDGLLVEAHELVARAFALVWMAEETPEAVPARVARRVQLRRH